MTPRRRVTVDRWVIVAAFLALAGSYFIGLGTVYINDGRTHDVAVSARASSAQTRRLTVRLAKVVKETRELRAEQLAKLHAAAAANCLGRHKQNVVLRDLILRSVAQAKALRFPGLTPAQQRTVDGQRAASLASLDRFLLDLRGADCLSVPPLPTKAK